MRKSIIEQELEGKAWKDIRVCICHGKPIKKKDIDYFDGSFEYFCSVNGEPTDTIIREGKSPTTLIFNAEEFECEARKDNPPENWRCVDGDKCTGYLLPKKGEYIYLCKWHDLKSCCKECKNKPFRLSSDAVLKSVGELFERKQMYPETPKVFDFECKICKKRLGKWEGKEHIKKHNLSESSKIVICEGYYV